MTQLDLFSLAPPAEKKEDNPLQKKQQARQAAANVKVPEVDVDLPDFAPADECGTPATSENNVPPLVLQQEKIKNERTGSIVFEDSRITVKLKTRPSPRKEDINKEFKGTGLPALPATPLKVEPKKSIVTKQPQTAYSTALREKLDTVKNSIKEGLLKDTQAEKKKKAREERPVQRKGRKSFKELSGDADFINIPEDEVLFTKQYYAISEVAGWFNVNTSVLRFWENEFDILKPRKNRKGDRMFRPEDVKNLQLIYELLRQRKYSIEGAREFIKTNKGKADTQMQLTQTLNKFKSFLLELKANL